MSASNDIFSMIGTEVTGVILDYSNPNADLIVINTKCGKKLILDGDQINFRIEQQQQKDAAKIDQKPAESLQTEWEEAYAAFRGAFDNLIARRKQPDEYAVDARQRLAAFDEKIKAVTATGIESLKPLVKAIDDEVRKIVKRMGMEQK